MKFKSNARYSEPVESGTIFVGRLENIRISVHRIVHCDGWYLSCPDLRISKMQLESDTLMSAIEESRYMKAVRTASMSLGCIVGMKTAGKMR